MARSEGDKSINANFFQKFSANSLFFRKQILTLQPETERLPLQSYRKQRKQTITNIYNTRIMETMTNNQRIETLNELRAQVTKEMDYCTRQIEMPALLGCNCIVATADAEYQVTVNDETHKAEILIGNYHEPCFFTEKMAAKVASEVKASNGFGPLTFIVWGWKSFYEARRNNLQKSLDCFNELLEKFNN